MSRRPPHRKGWANRARRIGDDGEFCPSAKLRYSTKTRARTAAANARAGYGQEFYFYRCEWCGDYHLTKDGRWGAKSA
jgi:hypothetical protein